MSFTENLLSLVSLDAIYCTNVTAYAHFTDKVPLHLFAYACKTFLLPHRLKILPIFIYHYQNEYENQKLIDKLNDLQQHATKL